MNSTDKKIAEILSKYGEDFRASVWRVQGTAVIYHKALERIAAQAGITFDEPKVIRAERDEAVMLVTGRMYRSVKVNEQLGNEATGEVFDNWVERRECRTEWSFGEALIGANYRVSGKQAAYVYAMAEKRAKDRVILKLIELSGDVYSEEEADEFKQGRPAPGSPDMTTVEVIENKAPPANDRQIDPDSPAGIEATLKQKITKAKTINAVTDLMLNAETQRDLSSLAEGIREEIRDFAKARLTELGWPGKKAS